MPSEAGVRTLTCVPCLAMEMLLPTRLSTLRDQCDGRPPRDCFLGNCEIPEHVLQEQGDGPSPNDREDTRARPAAPRLAARQKTHHAGRRFRPAFRCRRTQDRAVIPSPLNWRASCLPPKSGCWLDVPALGNPANELPMEPSMDQYCRWKNTIRNRSDGTVVRSLTRNFRLRGPARLGANFRRSSAIGQWPSSDSDFGPHAVCSSACLTLGRGWRNGACDGRREHCRIRRHG